MGVLKWLADKMLHAPRRKIDLDILWPSICKISPDLHTAKAAFAWHASHDNAWLTLGEQEIARQIDALRAQVPS